jgi:SAM-dependent methyltransferase
MNTIVHTQPGVVGRLRSRQSGLPTGLLGRIIGRAMVGATADSNDRALTMLDLSQPRTVLDVGFGQGRTAANLVRGGHRVIGVDASPTMVKQATARSRAACRDGRATLRHGDGIAIPFPDDSADAATSPASFDRAARSSSRVAPATRPHPEGWTPRCIGSRPSPRSSPSCSPPASATSSTSKATSRTTTSTSSSPDLPTDTAGNS